MNETFSVCQFFEDGSHEYVSKSVNVDEAAEAFSHLACVGGWIGTITRVIVTDNNEFVNLEWTPKDGIRKAVIVGVSNDGLLARESS